jgi:hypothetical protein
MKFFRFLMLTTFVCSTSVAASATSGRMLSKKSGRSDKQRLVALKMKATTTSTEVIETIETNTAPNESESTSNKVSETTSLETTNTAPTTKSKSNKEVKNNNLAPEPILDRQPVQVQVKLGNMDLEDLNAKETIYFESALRKAIQLAQEQDQEQGEDEQITIGAILVENGHGLHQHDGGRMLRGDRSLWNFNFSRLFSVWTIIETFRCRFCAPAAASSEDDDDYVAYDDFTSKGDYYDQWKEDMKTYTRAPTAAPTQRTSRPTRPMDEYDICWANNWLKGRQGGCRRNLGVSDSSTILEDTLCKLLREGPHECFHSVDECTLEVSKW